MEEINKGCAYRAYLKLIDWEKNFSQTTDINLDAMLAQAKQAADSVDAEEHIRRIRLAWASPEVVEQAREVAIDCLKIYVTEEDVVEIVEAFAAYPVLYKMQKASVGMNTDTQEALEPVNIEVTKMAAQSMVDEMAWSSPEWFKIMTLNGFIE